MKTLHKLALALIVTGTTLGFGSNALAGTQSGTTNVSATVPTNCTVPTVGNISIASYDPIASSSEVTATADITINCTLGTNVSFALDQGQHDGTTFRQALGSVSGDLLKYDIYTDSNHTTRWLAAAPNLVTDTGAGPGAGNILTEHMYVLVPGAQNVHADSYSDVVALTVSF